MASVAFTVKPEAPYSACPGCGNRTRFVAKSARCAEDCCEVWVECGECGHDPTADRGLYRLEDVWGSLDPHTVQAAMDVREELLPPTGGNGNG